MKFVNTILFRDVNVEFGQYDQYTEQVFLRVEETFTEQHRGAIESYLQTTNERILVGIIKKNKGS